MRDKPAKLANHEEGEVALEDLIGVRGERIAHLSPEERAEGRLLLRSCDALNIMKLALEGERIINDEDLKNAFDELRVHSETAEYRLRHWERKHGITE